MIVVHGRSLTFASCFGVMIASWAVVGTARASECSDLRAAVPQYRKCAVEAEAAIRKLSGGTAIPGGGSGSGMREQYEAALELCRHGEAEARRRLETCDEGGGGSSPPAAAPTGSTAGNSADSSDLARAQRELLARALQDRFRFDGRQSAEDVARVAELVRELRARLREVEGSAVDQNGSTPLDVELPEGSLYDLTPPEATPKTRAPDALDGSRLCREIEFRADGTSSSWPPGCVNPGALPELSFPGPPSAATLREEAQSYIERHDAYVEETNARQHVAGIPLQPQPLLPLEPAPWSRERIETMLDERPSSAPIVIDDADVLDALASELPPTHEALYRFNETNSNCVGEVVDGAAGELSDGVARPPARPCDDFLGAGRRAAEQLLLPGWMQDPRVRSFACMVFSCEEPTP